MPNIIGRSRPRLEKTEKTVNGYKKGNLTDDGIYQYKYDYKNRLVRVITKGTGIDKATYKYDTRNRRVEKTVVGTGTTTQYLYDGWQCVAELNGNGKPLATYIYGTDLDAIFSMRRRADASSPWTDYYYHTNANSNVTHITDSSGQVIERYEYDPFGTVTLLERWNGSAFVDKLTEGTQIGNPYLFQSRRWDPETRLYYYRNRYYSPTLGRFLTPDPIGYTDSSNLYQVVGNRPFDRADPLGLYVTKGLWRLRTIPEEHLKGLPKSDRTFVNEIVANKAGIAHYHVHSDVDNAFYAAVYAKAAKNGVILTNRLIVPIAPSLAHNKPRVSVGTSHIAEYLVRLEREYERREYDLGGIVSGPELRYWQYLLGNWDSIFNGSHPKDGKNHPKGLAWWVPSANREAKEPSKNNKTTYKKILETLIQRAIESKEADKPKELTETMNNLRTQLEKWRVLVPIDSKKVEITKDEPYGISEAEAVVVASDLAQSLIYVDLLKESIFLANKLQPLIEYHHSRFQSFLRARDLSKLANVRTLRYFGDKDHVILKKGYTLKDVLKDPKAKYIKTFVGNGPGNAFLHAYWNYLMAAHQTPSFAKEVADRHEQTIHSKELSRMFYIDQAKDLYNNAIGRAAAIGESRPIKTNEPFKQEDAKDIQAAERIRDIVLAEGAGETCSQFVTNWVGVSPPLVKGDKDFNKKDPRDTREVTAWLKPAWFDRWDADKVRAAK